MKHGQIEIPNLNDAMIESTRPVNVSSVPQRSPFRYPGGKTWFVPRFRTWLSSLANKPTTLIEPFAGGGILSLTAAFEGLADEIVMCEKDEWIASVWRVILSDESEMLAQRILDYDLTRQNVVRDLEATATTDLDIAFQTILKNRTYHGGIIARGAGLIKQGENGKGVSSRWYPETLAKRIRAIYEIRSKIRFVCGDGLLLLNERRLDSSLAWIIDPPYTAGGKRAGSRLYRYSEIDHEKLFDTCSELQSPFLMTYDIAPEVVEMARVRGFQCIEIPMKNTHHAEMKELVICSDLSWITGN